MQPLRGQNNVQGGGDMGAIPNRLPGFQDILDPVARGKFERTWETVIQPRYGMTLTGMFEAMESRELRAVYCIGENPAQSEADSEQARIDNELYVRDDDKCILCLKCVDACGEQWQNTFAIAVAGRGFDARISVEQDAPLTDSVCAYCGVGCNLTLHVQDNEIVKVTSAHDNPVTHGNLCIKGRFGYQHVQQR
ncbi:hypothetical protein GCM10010346_35110 [Streptomyces chryseus]|uniref:Uncharacterized protein n=1 Tax=Streptomyces chryseus TaxID=68186 RepID=A0ABQ3DN83_9ACTN|nr:hypothetical protein GCM10010346_35110 [Streptomyces chryseus]